MPEDVLAISAILIALMLIHDISIVRKRINMRKKNKDSKVTEIEKIWCSHCEEEVEVVTKMFETKLCSKCGIILEGKYYSK